MNKYVSFVRYYFHINDIIDITINNKLKTTKYKITRLNIDYINNKITNDVYESKIILNEKCKEILNEKKMILNTLKTTINDILFYIFINYISKISTKNPINTSIELFKNNTDVLDFKIEDLIDYSDKQLKEINYSYKSKSNLNITFVPNIINP